MFASLVDGIEYFINQPEFKTFSVQNDHFKHSPKILTQIKAHNPKYTKATQSSHWQNHFGRDPKSDATPFKVFNDKGVGFWLYDVTQTKGRPLAEIIHNISGEVQHYQLVWDCLTNFISQPVVFMENDYYSGKGQDSISKDGKIIMRPALSQQQKVFALIREIVRTNQTSAIVIEAVSFMVCRHLNFDTGAFSFGYLLELMDYDVSLKLLRSKDIEDTIANEAAVLIGNLNGSLPFLQGASSEGSSSGGNVLELEERHENIGKQKEAEKVDEVPYTKKVRTETVNDLDFQIIAILRDFMRTLPDKKVSEKEMIDYGYHDTNMLPMRGPVAKKLFMDKCEIYRLYQDGTHTRADTLNDIESHSGLYGISSDEWFAVKSRILRSSMDNEVKKISLWEQAAAGNIKPGGTENTKQRKTLEHKKQAHQARSAHKKGKQPEQDEHEEAFEFDKNGNMVFVTDDIKHSDMASYEWIDGAMEDLIDNHGYKTSHIPYFREHNGLGISTEMEEINQFMVRYCYFCISDAIKEHTEKCKKTGNSRYFVLRAVRQILVGFNAQYIALALKTYWKEWKTPDKVKVQFYKDFMELRKIPQPQMQQKKSTPEEDMARMKAREEAKNTNSTDNGQSNQKGAIEHRNKIINLINAYKDNIRMKPKNTKTERPTVKAMRESTKTR